MTEQTMSDRIPRRGTSQRARAILWPVAIMAGLALTTAPAASSDAAGLRSFRVAGMSTDGLTTNPPPPSPAPPLPPLPRYDPAAEPKPPPFGSQQPEPLAEIWWGAIGFTADGSYSSAWKVTSRAEAEAKAAKGCAALGRGRCEIVTFSGQECVALSTFAGSYARRRWNLSFTAGGYTYPEAQSAAMQRCNADERTQGRCQPRTVACANGR